MVFGLKSGGYGSPKIGKMTGFGRGGNKEEVRTGGVAGGGRTAAKSIGEGGTRLLSGRESGLSRGERKIMGFPKKETLKLK